MTREEYIDKINFLIRDEFEAIEGYNKVIREITHSEPFYQGFGDIVINKLKHIRDEEVEHVEELEDLRSLAEDDDSKIDLED